MMIAGLQKCTLLDYPNRVACTVFLPGCNFRCPYCHNFELTQKPEPVMDDEGLLAFLRGRQGLLQGVCVTGGEPTLQPRLPRLLERIRALGFAVKLDTNGSRPEVLRDLLEAGLVDYVAMDIKSSPAGYAAACGAVVDCEKISQSVRLLLEGQVDYELRTTVAHPLHDVQTIEQMAQWLRKIGKTPVKKLFLQPFVDRETVPFSGLTAPDEQELRQMQAILSTAAEQVHIRGISV